MSQPKLSKARHFARCPWCTNPIRKDQNVRLVRGMPLVRIGLMERPPGVNESFGVAVHPKCSEAIERASRKQ